MSDPYTGARAPDETPVYGDVPTQPAYAAETYPPAAYPPVPVTPATYPATTPAGDSGSGGAKEQVKEKAGEVKDQAKEVAGQSKEAAGQAAREVAGTAKEQAQRVGSEAKTQARSVASDVRDRVTGEARSQTDRFSGTIREVAGQLDEMRGDREGTPAATVVSRVADGGRQLADYLDSNGPEGVLREVGDFARRRPGAFLVTALAAGFVVGRLGKGVMKADEVSGKPAGDQFSSTGSGYATGPGYDETPASGFDAVPTYPATTPATTGYTTAEPGYATTAESGYATGTEYASTGTGTPVIAEEYVEERPGGLR